MPKATLFFSLLTLSLLSSTTTAVPPSSSSSSSSLSALPPDAIALLSFKSKADLDNKLLYRLTERYDYCQWQGIKCAQGRVVRITLQNFGLRGTFPPNTLSRLDQLRTLSLRNNSLSGSLPDLTNLTNLKTLVISRNMFHGHLPFWVLSMYKLKVLDLSFNNFSGSIPVGLNKLVRLSVLKLEFNSFDGFMPALDLSSLVVFNVTRNNLTGKVPATPMLLRFGRLSFLGNDGVCGEVVNKGCPRMKPFFGSNHSSGLMPLSGPSQGAMAPPAAEKRGNRIGLVIGLVIGFGVVLAACFLVLAVVRRGRSDEGKSKQMESSSSQVVVDAHHSSSVVQPQPQPQQERQCGEVVGMVSKIPEVRRSGELVFCAGQARLYSMDQLMRASAELLGRGTIGITYKAVLDSQLIVTVKRLDASKTAITSTNRFERHMAAIGGLWHPNLVPLRAYFQSKGERLVIYEYRPNGSLFNLVHGSRSARAKPLHWTSCLKIAEDVAQGLAYIHQTSKLVHGNLKSTNVLLGADFEACITDCCLSVLADLTSSEDPDSAAYRAPESRKSSERATSKSDVYAFGVLLLELLTGKPPSQHPFLVPTELPDWVRAMRDDDGGEENQLGMLTEVAGLCRVTSPEQRPAMWQVLNMIQDIKEIGLAEDNTMGFS